MIALEIAVVGLIVLLNGFFAMSELAIVSSRRPRLQQLAATDDHRARIALTLVDDSSRFLAVVQIGMTLTAILAGTFSGATLADRLGDWLNTFEPLAHYNKPVAIILVVVPVSYFSVPRRNSWVKSGRFGRPEACGIVDNTRGVAPQSSPHFLK